MPEGSQINQGNISMSCLQSEGQVYGDGGCAASTLGVNHGEDFAARTITLYLALRGGESNEGLQQVRGGRGTLDELLGSHAIALTMSCG